MTHEIVFASIEELSDDIRSGALSPVEVVDASLKRIHQTEPKLNAFLELFEEGAQNAARLAEAEIREGRYRGPLHGIPVALKDLVNVAGSPTTGGSPLFQQNVAHADATIARRFRQAGAIIIGKTNLVMHAMGAAGLNPYTGHPHNPWDLSRCTGGSSSGSGAAVAAGCIPAAIGTDTGGSIRMPAALCGIAGLKPTYGRVSRAGVMDLSWSCDHVGPMARRVSDCAYVMNALAGFDPHDPASADEPVEDYTLALNRGLEGLQIGVPSDYFFEESVDPEIKAAVYTAIELMMSNGVEAIEIPMPWAQVGRSINMGIVMPESVAVHKQNISNHPETYTDEIRARLQSAMTIAAVDYVQAQRARRWFIEKMNHAMRHVDVIITPTVPEQTPTIEEADTRPGENVAQKGGDLPNFTGVFNTTGQPSMSVPCGFTKNGMPIGLMITGHHFDEATVLRVGNAYESLAPWHTYRPTLSPSDPK